MSYEQAQAAVAPAFAKPLRLTLADKQWAVRPSRFGTSVAVSDGVARALDAKRGAAVELVPAIDAAAVQSYVRALDKRFSYPAKDAQLLGLTAGLQPRFSDPTAGQKVATGATAKRIVRALRRHLHEYGPGILRDVLAMLEGLAVACD